MFDTNWEMISGSDAREIEVLNATNQLNVLDGLLTLLLAHRGPFGTGNAPMPDDAAFCELHRAGTLFLLAEPGCYRNLEVEVKDANGIVTFKPIRWQFVSAFMQHFYRELSSVWTSGDALDVAAYALWRINWIHPFRNGNGRTARAFSYACLCLKLGVKLPGQPTVIDQLMANRPEYEAALQAADQTFALGKIPDLAPMKNLLNNFLQIQIAAITP
jgi:Fic family protein